MSDLISDFSSLFTFLFTQLGNFATWFVSNTIGKLILGILIFSFVVSLVGYILGKIRR